MSNPSSGGGHDGQKKPRSKRPFIIAGAVVLIAAICIAIYWFATRNEVSTDDAYTDGNTISIATNVSGYVTQLYVNDNQFVHKGDLLLVVDPRADEAQLAQAQSNLNLAQANLRAAQINLSLERVRAPAQLAQAQAGVQKAEAQLTDAKSNYKREIAAGLRATSATKIDQAREQLQTAQAQVKQAQAELANAQMVQQNIAASVEQVALRQAQAKQALANFTNAQVQLSYNYIRAPQDGWITLRSVDPGTYVQAGMQVFEIVAKTVWITANFKETQLARMRPGQHVTISVDAYPSLKLRGHVQSIQKGSGAQFSAFPAQNATGNFVKIVRRVPVKIVIDSGLTAAHPMLPLGLSAEPTVHE